MSESKRIEELELALEKALQEWEHCLRFKGAYLTKIDKDVERIDAFRRLLRGN